MKKVLVLCTGNSCRSQIAEGYLRFFSGGKAKIFSAGIEAHGINPVAIRVMMEDGIDISDHTSDTIAKYRHESFDFIITVCDNARENCPVFPSTAIQLHQNFPDPAHATGTEGEILEKFREVRNMIKDFSSGFCNEHL